MIKLTPEILEYAKLFYLDNHSIKETKYMIYKKYGVEVSRTGIEKRFKKLGISGRSRKEVGKLFLRKSLSKEIIDKIKYLYVIKNYGIRKINRELSIDRPIIRRTLVEQDIKIRSCDEAIILSHRKHKRFKFSEDKKEKAYLIGLTEGDIHARKKSKFTLRLTSASTHKDFIFLLKSSFEKYGPVYIYPTKNKDSYNWNFTTDLDYESFKFLLESNRSKYINNLKNKFFLDFLAGLIDSDGSIYPKKTGKYVQCVLRIFAEDIGLLEKVKCMLRNFQYSPNLGINAKKGDTSRGFIYNEDYYNLELSRKQEVLHILKRLNLKHPEKIKRKAIMLGYENKVLKHRDLEEMITLRNNIKQEVVKYIEEARVKLAQKIIP
jgi:hypothetical protein